MYNLYFITDNLELCLVVGRSHDDRPHHSEKPKSRDMRDVREMLREKEREREKERKMKDNQNEIEKREKSRRER